MREIERKRKSQRESEPERKRSRGRRRNGQKFQPRVNLFVINDKGLMSGSL